MDIFFCGDDAHFADYIHDARIYFLRFGDANAGEDAQQAAAENVTVPNGCSQIVLAAVKARLFGGEALSAGFVCLLQLPRRVRFPARQI